MLSSSSTLVPHPSFSSTFLPSDILEEIFDHLEVEYENDPSGLLSTLYSCAYVNRNFCKNVIPYIWRKPFYSRKNGLNFTKQKSQKSAKKSE
ncbi:14352_t:CDS:1, partial [Acaulospora morrowiae]